MLKQLRRKFIGIAMVSICAVVLILLVAVNLFNYNRTIGTLDTLLDVLAENDGVLPGSGLGAANRNRGQTGGSGQAGENGMPGGSGNGFGKDFFSNPEAVFSTRYFVVRFDADGNVLSSQMDFIAAVSDDEAQAMAEAAAAAGRAYGSSGVYRWHLYTTDSGYSVLFLDARSEFQTVQSLLLTTLGVAAGGIAAVLALVILLSGRAIRPIAESVEKQKRFITDAGHELKTPLTIISANTDLLELTTGDNEWIQSIRNQLRRLTRLVNELVSLSRLDEEKPPIVMEQFSLSDAVLDAALAFSGPAEAAGKPLRVEAAPGLSYTGDEKSIRQLVSLLTDNAVKYCDAGGSIDVRLEESKRGPVLTVTNPCAGLTGDDLDRLFDRFYRADPSRSSETGGYGIGLSIAKAICDAHKARISVTDTDGKVTFKVSF